MNLEKKSLTDREFARDRVKSDVNGVLEICRVRDVGLVVFLVTFSCLVTAMFFLFGIRFFRERPHIDGYHRLDPERSISKIIIIIQLLITNKLILFPTLQNVSGNLSIN